MEKMTANIHINIITIEIGRKISLDWSKMDKN